MSDDVRIATKQAYVDSLAPAWARLQDVIHEVQQRGHDGLRDDAGWTATDHLAHLAVWAHSTMGMIRSGRPQWEGLGVPHEAFNAAMASGDFDELNEMIRKNTHGWSLERAVSTLTEAHEEIEQAVAGMTEKALEQPGFAYAPEGGDAPILEKLASNTSLHYIEHCEYIDRILANE